MTINFGTRFLRANPIDIRLEWDKPAQKRFEDKLDAIIGGMADSAERWAGKVGAEILSLSTNKYLPIDIGTLAKSSYTIKDVSEKYIMVEVGYNGDGSAPYAVDVHEDMEINVKAKTRPPWRHGSQFNDYHKELISSRRKIDWFGTIREVGDHRKPEQRSKYLETAFNEKIPMAKKLLGDITITEGRLSGKAKYGIFKGVDLDKVQL